jgi:L-threonylcarbamoyladenylate synthase
MMPTLYLSAENTNRLIVQAVLSIFHGGIIAYPTETLYGLGAKYDNEQALMRLYELKRRPHEKTIPIIIGSIEQLSLLVNSVNETAADLIKKFWPGPMTLVFDARSGLSSYITCNNKIAVRIPGESFALDLVRAAGFPITATSANISGLPAARDASMISEYFNDRVDLIIDGGTSQNTQPSTIVDVTRQTAVVLREGAISARRIFTR